MEVLLDFFSQVQISLELILWWFPWRLQLHLLLFYVPQIFLGKTCCLLRRISVAALFCQGLKIPLLTSGRLLQKIFPVSSLLQSLAEQERKILKMLWASFHLWKTIGLQNQQFYLFVAIMAVQKFTICL